MNSNGRISFFSFIIAIILLGYFSFLVYREFNPNSPSYNKEVKNLKTLVKEIKKENEKRFKDDNYKNYNLSKLKTEIEIFTKTNKDFTIDVRVSEKELNNFLDVDFLELEKLAKDKGYSLQIDSNYWKNKTVGDLQKIEIFSSMYIPDKQNEQEKYKNSDNFFSLKTEIYSSSADELYDGVYYGNSFYIFVTKEQWEKIKKQIFLVQEQWKRISDSNNYKETQIEKILDRYLTIYSEKYVVAIIELKFIK